METATPSPAGNIEDADGPRRLVRTPDKKIAGVAAGIAHYLGVDPTIVRIAFVGLAFVGGAGVLLYLVCTLLMPKGEADPRSATADPIGTEATLALIGLAIGVALLVGWHGIGSGVRAGVAAVLVVGGLLLLGRRTTTARSVPAPTPTRSRPPETPPLDAHPAAPRAGAGGSRTSGLIFGGVAIAGAVLGALALGGSLDVSVASGIAIALVVVGAGVCVAAFTSGSTALVAIGGVLTVALLGSAGVDRVVRHGVGERTISPASLVDLRSDYRYGVGDFTLDLRNVDLAGTSRSVRVRLSIGQATIIVPPTADVHVKANVQGGVVDLPDGTTRDGWDVGVDWEETAAAGGGHLGLDVDMTFGEVLIRRG
jgi:phage shock protein PspC (stress-responsive transcriptional regulator)